jgi:aspartokinase|tara:strand:+ start:2688 stop:3344 length:657 start_codon:yes stop_codon:yes gene_type:complete
MTPISDQVKIFLDNDFIMRRCLFRNVISFRALSRYIIKLLDLEEKNLDAVMSAIRRYKREEKIKTEAELKKIFSNIAIKTRNNIVDICVKKSKKILEQLNKINSIVDIEKGEIIRIIQAEEGIRIIIDGKNLDKFNNYFSKNDCISIEKNLVEINLHFTSEASKTKGIIALISSSLNAEDINIVEIISSAPELLLFLKKDELLKALNVINNLEKILKT